MCTLVIRAWPAVVSTVSVVLFPLSSLGVMVMVYESMLSLKLVVPYPSAGLLDFRKGLRLPCADGSHEDRQCIPDRDSPTRWPGEKAIYTRTDASAVHRDGCLRGILIRRAPMHGRSCRRPAAWP
jgi:hypothetical protein